MGQIVPNGLLPPSQSDRYLHHKVIGGIVITFVRLSVCLSVCLFVCLFVSRITQKLLDQTW